MNSVIEVKNLTKLYSPSTGVHDVNFVVKPQEIIGFVGPNGAGKSTTMRLIMQLTRPDNGSVSLFGQEIKSETDMLAALPKIGYLPAEDFLYPTFTAWQIANIASSFFDIRKADELIEKLRIDPHKAYNQMSLGNKKKLGLFHALLHDPDLLILDEPAAGLDPLMQEEVRIILNEFRQKGKTVFLSSHNLDEVQTICDRIIMIKGGEIILDKAVEELTREVGKKFRIINPSKALTAKLKNYVEKLLSDSKEMIFITHKPVEVIEVLTSEKHYDFFIEEISLEYLFLDSYK